MKIVAHAGGIIALAAMLAFFVLWGKPVPQKAEVVLTTRGFEPREVTIERGGHVTFTTTAGKPFWPASNLHPNHTLYPEFDPKRPLQPHESWSFAFEKTGGWHYHDHLRSYFVGVVQVVD